MSPITPGNVVLAIRRRAVLAVYVGIAAMLLIFFPVLYVAKTGELVRTYVYLISCCVFLFFVPVILISEFWLRKVRIEEWNSRKEAFGKFGVLLFFAAAFVFCCGFLYVSISNDLFFRRIGFEGLVRNSLAMPLADRAIHRTFMEVAVTVVCAGLAVLLSSIRFGSSRWIVCAALWLGTLLPYFAFVLINNRFQLGILELCLVLTVLYIRPGLLGGFLPFSALIACLIIFTWFSIRVAENIRQEIYLTGCIDVRALNPFETAYHLYDAHVAQGVCRGVSFKKAQIKDLVKEGESKEKSKGTTGKSVVDHYHEALRLAIDSEVKRPLVERLNGLALMADITGPAATKGWGMGRFWSNSVLLYYYYFFDREKYLSIKTGLATNPKVYEVNYYLGEKIKDRESSVLSDIYGNFSFPGILFAGVFVGCLIGFSQKVLLRSRNVGLVVLALFVLERVLYAEKEFITLVLDLIKFSPVVLISAALLWGVGIDRHKTADHRDAAAAP